MTRLDCADYQGLFGDSAWGIPYPVDYLGLFGDLRGLSRVIFPIPHFLEFFGESHDGETSHLFPIAFSLLNISFPEHSLPSLDKRSVTRSSSQWPWRTSAYHTCLGSYFLLQEKIASVCPPFLFARKRKVSDFDFDFVLLFSA